MLKKYGLEGAFQIDVFNTSDGACDRDEQKALFLTQLEVVRPKAMLIMDMSSSRKKRSDGWHYPEQPLPVLLWRLDADGFSVKLGPGSFDRHSLAAAAKVQCDPLGAPEFSFNVYRIFHYVKLADHRWADDPEAKWEERFARITKIARLEREVADLRASLARADTRPTRSS